ncbi:hypothetical protein VTJ83DRAFT_6126 [Remersonia thermophila]|uniref:Uncharacterized protein n=1 Tax=Remersonia thermophila TaxID=72144 RepID=A0ABR4DAY0_9PEZI
MATSSHITIMETFTDNIRCGLKQSQGSQLPPCLQQRYPQLLGRLPPLPTASAQPRSSAMPALLELTREEAGQSCEHQIRWLPEASVEEGASQRQLDSGFATLLLQQQQSQVPQQQQPPRQPPEQPRLKTSRQKQQAGQQPEQPLERKRNRYKSSPEDDLEELERKQRLRQLRVKNMKTWQEGAVADLQVAASCTSSASSSGGFGTLGIGTLAALPSSSAATSPIFPSQPGSAPFVPAGVPVFGLANSIGLTQPTAFVPPSIPSSRMECAFQAWGNLHAGASASDSNSSRLTQTADGQLARPGRGLVLQRSACPATGTARAPGPAPDAAVSSQDAKPQTPETPATTLVALSPSPYPLPPAALADAERQQQDNLSISAMASASAHLQSHPTITASPGPIADELYPETLATQPGHHHHHWQQQQQQQQLAPERSPDTTATTLVAPSPVPSLRSNPAAGQEKRGLAMLSSSSTTTATITTTTTAAVHHDQDPDPAAMAEPLRDWDMEYSWMLTDTGFEAVFGFDADPAAEADLAGLAGSSGSAPDLLGLCFPPDGEEDPIGMWASHHHPALRGDSLASATSTAEVAGRAESPAMVLSGLESLLPPALFVAEENPLDENPLGL